MTASFASKRTETIDGIFKLKKESQNDLIEKRTTVVFFDVEKAFYKINRKH